MQPISIDHLQLSVPQMDNQHRALIGQVNEFSAAADAGAARAELVPRLTALVDAFQAHFDSEERMMQFSGYPGLTPHAAEHQKLILQMAGLRDLVESGDVKMGGALVLFVRLWTEQHISGPDVAFAKFYLDNLTNIRQ